METGKLSLKKITDTAFYLPDRIHTGIIRGDGNACLVVDTGLDKTSANRIQAALQEESFCPAALLITHTHADHCGGNLALHQKFNMPTYGPPFEVAILNNPMMEPMYLYGAAPPAVLLNKFFLAAATPDALPLPPGRHEIGGVPVTAVALPGHSPGHTGYLTDDGVLFSGDAMLPEYVWEKYRLPYFYDIGDALASLDKLEGMAAGLRACVTAHYGPVDAAQLVQANRNGLLGLAGWAASALTDAPRSREDMIAAAFQEFKMTQNEAQYYLIGSTIAALLTYLCNEGKIEARMSEGKLIYTSK